MTETRKLRVFLCHSSQDKPIVRELYQRLNAEGWIDPWLDEEKLLPGQDWDMEIEKAVEVADVVIVCLSRMSVNKEGYIQRELKFALDIALEKPEGTIFIIPLRLDDVQPPRRIRSWQYVDYFPIERKSWSYRRLLESLQLRKDLVGIDKKDESMNGKKLDWEEPDWLNETSSEESQDHRLALLQLAHMLLQEPAEDKTGQVLADVTRSKHKEMVFKNGLAQIPLAAYLITTGILFIFPFPLVIQAFLAFLAGVSLVVKRNFSNNRLFNYSLISCFILGGVFYFVPIPNGYTVTSMLLLVSGGSLVWSILFPKNSDYYSAPISAFIFAFILLMIGMSASGVSFAFTSLLITILQLVVAILIYKKI